MRQRASRLLRLDLWLNIGYYLDSSLDSDGSDNNDDSDGTGNSDGSDDLDDSNSDVSSTNFQDWFDYLQFGPVPWGPLSTRMTWAALHSTHDGSQKESDRGCA